jgi:hypothetical protein
MAESYRRKPTEVKFLPPKQTPPAAAVISNSNAFPQSSLSGANHSSMSQKPMPSAVILSADGSIAPSRHFKDASASASEGHRFWNARNIVILLGLVLLAIFLAYLGQKSSQKANEAKIHNKIDSALKQQNDIIKQQVAISQLNRSQNDTLRDLAVKNEELRQEMNRLLLRPPQTVVVPTTPVVQLPPPPPPPPVVVQQQPIQVPLQQPSPSLSQQFFPIRAPSLNLGGPMAPIYGRSVNNVPDFDGIGFDSSDGTSGADQYVEDGSMYSDFRRKVDERLPMKLMPALASTTPARVRSPYS